eukprot:4962438-Alexandrium_andersonii.AAC.1
MSGRGGHHQRSARREESQRKQNSALGEYLIDRFLFGSFSAAKVQELAYLAVLDHDQSPALL